ncbi:MAG: DUF5320 domain-containing protein [Candidatus Alkanophagales archaeon]
MRMGYGWRWMFRLTGLPGWLRLGFSPGWLGRSPTGLPPAASYILQTGQLPQFLSYLQTQLPAPATPPTPPPTAAATPTPTATATPPQPLWSPPPMSREQEIAMLEAQAKWLEETLSQIKKRLEELQK